MDLTGTLPRIDGALRIQGLRGPVTLARDRWGIPHVRAREVWDAFLTQGFVHAQDRMWHMEWDRRRAYGRTAELIGANGVEADRLARRFQIERASQADWQILNDETHAMVEAYTAGVNAFLAQGARLPSSSRCSASARRHGNPGTASVFSRSVTCSWASCITRSGD